MKRRHFLELASLAGLPGAASAAGFPEIQPQRALFPCPVDGAAAGVNPPGFAWWRAQGAASYRLVVRDGAGRTVCEAANLKDPVHLPDRILAPGEYCWDVEALDSNGAVVARRGEWRFRVPKGVPELAWEDAARILSRAPAEHSRYIFLKSELPRIRQTLKTTRRAAWEALLEQANRALRTPLPEPPRYHTFEGRERQRMGYTRYFGEFRRRVDSTLTALSLAWLLSGQERYGERARQLLLEIGGWGVDGPMSLLSPFGDEPGLSLARHGQRAYDWLYPLFTDSERERARRMTVDRGRQILERMRRHNYLTSPAESHDGRLIAYLAEYALVLKDETPEAPEWLDYSLKALTTFYPHWGDSDGGWAEGISYALSYNTIYLAAIESLRAATGFDLFKRPFFQNVRKFFLYCVSPVGEIKPFGDGAERGGMGGGAVLLTHHARRFNDPACLWWAEQTGERAVEPLISMITEDTVPSAPPRALAQAAVFRGVGWAALHGALDDPKNDTFILFKSSPFASVSHSHADQNSFAILKGGRALAIPSGHYGPAYGMPHHADWTRQTRANNSILVNGAGQTDRSAEAKGKVAAFRHQKALTYLCGDATAAYGGRLSRFLRRVLFLRPGVLVVLDELAAPAPAAFSWLLHAFEKMRVSEAEREVVSTRQGASLTVRLASENGLVFEQTDQFDPPYNQGNPPEYQEDRPNHWHFTARTRTGAAETRIAAVMVVRGPEEKFETQWRDQAGWAGLVLRSAEGEGEVWAQVKAGAKPPAWAGSPNAILAGRWKPVKGAAETLSV